MVHVDLSMVVFSNFLRLDWRIEYFTYLQANSLDDIYELGTPQNYVKFLGQVNTFWFVLLHNTAKIERKLPATFGISDKMVL